jgi:glucose-1-phosphate thymidylyltransferase
MVDWILDKIRETDADEIHLVTNARFAPDFERWTAGAEVRVHDDGTLTNEDRLGAIGDIRFVLERAGIDDDLLVVAGDNLFDFSLVDYTAFWRSKGGSSVAVYDVGDLELVKLYSVVEVDADDRIVNFVEKPSAPTSTLIATAAYLFAREHATLIDRYLSEGNPPDQPGNLVAWLQTRVPVYAYRFPGEWHDVGDSTQLLVADNRMRARTGLPLRQSYSLSD